MSKALLLAVALAACTLPTSSQTTNELGCDELNYNVCADAGTDNPDDPEPPPENGPTCPIHGIAVALDTLPANVDNDDGKVSYCHATSSPTNPFVILTTSTSACTAHENHTHLPQGGEEDRFGTDGCED